MNRSEEEKQVALEYLSEAWLYESTDPKAKIYGMHGILKYWGIHVPDPDYSKTLEQALEDSATVTI